ncbi:NAD(P)H-binding protein [Streptomyces kaniharaensis]|uniref:NAD(P)H-binding protein n=1 Tax=Streptomyces kaniharaensis TaxID=212423 RepID=A0A6N7KZI8_9ACTN|nr:NAD-dependent epimerase/dehydratase family protein [Streptomyces kaniharaensis]MQS15678.1 NAD(P)H-binding protein [Streptomyces kaniharaensis]
MEQALVIGGNRYFGRRLVTLLRDSGVHVSVLNRGSAAPPPGVTHLVADREDETALAAALAGRSFDVVVDQVCYTASHAEGAVRAFAGRVGRYVMTSTIEVYDTGEARPAGVPLGEHAFDPAQWRMQDGDGSYGEGKRQAEAVFTRSGAFPFVTVRAGHVLGAADFTGRLAYYRERIDAGLPVAVHPENLPSSYTHEAEMADVLYWAAGADFTGAVNACSYGELTATDICELVAAGRPYRTAAPAPGEEASPFSFDRYYGMDNSRAEQLGYTFSHTRDWLPELVAATR